MRTPRLLTLAVVVAAGSTALAQEIPRQGQPAGYGVTMPSGSKVTTALGNDLDVDDYVFVGYPGQKAKISLKIDKSSAVQMHLELIRPDGTVVAPDDGDAKFKTGEELSDLVRFENPGGDPPFEDREIGTVEQTLKIQYTLDQVGTWKVRVRAPELDVPAGDAGEYTLAVKYSKPPKTKLKDPEQDEPGLFEFLIAAEGGALIDFKFKHKGGEVTFNGLQAPNGDFIDVADDLKVKAGKLVRGKKIELDSDLPVGEYLVSFSHDPGTTFKKTFFVGKAKLPKDEGKRKGRISRLEPLIATTGINPNIGGPPTLVTVNVLNAFDPPNDPTATPQLLLDDRALAITEVLDNGTTTTIKATVGSIGEGTFDVVVRTAGGQVDVLEDAFTRVPPPVVSSIDPVVGSSAGGFEIVITGSGFPTSLSQIGVLIDGFDVPVNKISVTPTELRFEAPPRAPTFVTFGIRDLRSQLTGNLPINSFEYLSTPGISRITPGLVPILGGDTIFVRGTNFRETDSVYMETATPGVYELVAGPTYLNPNLHSFVAPVRPKGSYEIYVQDNQGVRTTGRRTIGYFQYADFTGDAGLRNPDDDLLDGWSTALSDFDQDGDTDVFIAKRGPEQSRASDAQITILVNDGTGNLTVATDRIPQPTSTDDWRADKIEVVDITQDGFPDIVITTDDKNVLPAGVSHTRILVSVRRSAQSPNSDRVFVDRTLELMPPPRRGKSGVSNTDGDNWRGLDMWVGDVDSGPVGPPEILITHNEVKEELNVLCGNYCNTTITGNASYSFYWGGSRALVWDARARGGQGRYKFEHNFFPRKSGVTVPIGNPPPGVVIPSCSANQCRGTFTPFTGHILRVADINADRRPDVVVISDEDVQKNGQNISSTQVGLFGFSSETGSFITDITGKLTDLGGPTKAHAAVIGLFGFPDGNSYGTIVMAQDNNAAGGRAIRLLQFEPSQVEGDPGGFVDITSQVVPPASGNEAWQASALQVADIDTDGDQDLVLVAKEAPGPGEPAFRILRNVIESSQLGILRPEFAGLIEPIAGGSEPFDGTSLLVGDLDGDQAPEFIVTRSEADGEDTQTRIITTDR